MIISIILYVWFSLFIIGLAVRGFFKGIVWGSVGLLHTVTSALISFGIVRLIAIFVPIGDLLSPLFSGMEGNALISAGSSLIGALIYSALLPFIFGFIFGILYLVLIAPFRAIAKAIEKKIAKNADALPTPAEEPVAPAVETAPVSESANESVTDPIAVSEPAPIVEVAVKAPKKPFPVTKLCGALVKAVDAALILVLLVLPISGLIYTLTDGADAILESADKVKLELPIESGFELFGEELTDKSGNLDFGKTRELLDETTSPVCDNIYLKLSYTAPFKALYSAIGAYEGSNIALGNEMTQTLDLLSNLVYLAAPLNQYGDDQVDAIKSIGAYVSESYYHSTVASDLVSEYASGLTEDEELLGGNQIATVVITPLLEGLAATTPETISANVETIATIASELVDTGVLSEESDIADLIGNEEFLETVIVSVYDNENLRDSASTMINSAMNVALEQLGGEESEKIEINFASVSVKTVKEEAKMLAGLVSSAYKTTTALENGDFSKADTAEAIKALGSALDTARNSELLADSTDKIVMTVLKSEVVSSSASGLAEIVEKYIDKEGLSFENMFSSVAQILVIVNASKDTETDSVAILTEALGELSASLDPVTAEIIKDFSAKNDILGSGASKDEPNGGVTDPDDPSDGESLSQTVVNVFVDKLSSGEITEDEREREAKALDYALKLITMKENEGINSVKDVYGTKEGMKEMISVFIDSELTADIIHELAYDKDGNLTYDALSIAKDFDDDDMEAFLDGCEAVYREKAAEGADMDTVRENLIAVGYVFGCDLDVRIEQWNKTL